MPAGGRELQPEDAGEGGDEQDDQAGSAGQVAADVGPERGAADGQGDEAHDLAEDPARLVAGEGPVADAVSILLGDGHGLDFSHRGQRTDQVAIGRRPPVILG